MIFPDPLSILILFSKYGIVAGCREYKLKVFNYLGWRDFLSRHFTNYDASMETM